MEEDKIEMQRIQEVGRLRAYLKAVGLDAWFDPFQNHLPANVKTVELVRATTAADLRRMGTAANMRLDDTVIQQVLDALKKAEPGSAQAVEQTKQAKILTAALAAAREDRELPPGLLLQLPGRPTLGSYQSFEHNPSVSTPNAICPQLSCMPLQGTVFL